MYPLNQAPLLNPGGSGTVLGHIQTQSSTIAVPNGGKLKLPDGGDRLFERGQFKKVKIEARRRMRAIIKSALPLGRKVDDVTPTIVSSYSLSSSVNASQLNASSLKVVPPPITKPMTPPGWQNYYDELVRTATQYGSFPVDPKSFEYRKIVEMVEPFTVLSINKIVNRKVWDDYATKRRQLLKQKSEDPDVWLTLDLTEIEVEGRTKRDKEFREQNPSLSKSKGKYDLNEALLFHCTRYKKNVVPILKQGLDERLGANTTNVLMGKGIYFADHPKKSCGYVGDSQTIILFTVILGDCKDMEHEGEEAKTLTAEPVKKSEEKRNVDDLRFDSITGRPNYPEYNEFVIFDRNQCCPMYEIKLCQKSIDSPVVERAPGHEDFGYFRGQTPDFVWKKQKQLPYYIPGWQNDMLKWPFFISTLYETVDLNKNLELLQELGYKDGAVNEYVLSELDNDFEEAVLFIKEFIEDQFQEKSDEDDDKDHVPKKCRISPKKIKTILIPTTSLSSISYSTLDMKKPIICRSCKVKYGSKNCFDLKCKHRVCSVCFPKLHKSGKTMIEEIPCTWIKCPICWDVDGMEIGNSPTGEMVVERVPGLHCNGHTDVATLEIIYTVMHNGVPDRRTAFLPDTPKGQLLQKLLMVAWDRKLILTIGESISRGLKDVPIWNIEHKTNLNGGEQNYGYPDVTYLDRTIKHLKIYGIY